MTEETKETFEIAAKAESDRNDRDYQIEEKPEKIRERVHRTVRLLDRHYLELGMDLKIIYERKLWKDWNYSTFNAFVYNEIGRSDAWVKDMLNVWKKYRDELILTDEKLEGIGFTKACAMLPVINKANQHLWLEKAKKGSLADLRRAVKQEKESWNTEPVDASVIRNFESSRTLGSANLSDASVVTSGDSPRPVGEDEFTRKTFMLVPEQLRWLEEGLMALREETGSSKDGYLLTCLVSFYLNHKELNADKGRENPLLWMRSFEQRFGGNLVWIKNETQANLLREVIEDNKDAFKTGGMTNE